MTALKKGKVCLAGQTNKQKIRKKNWCIGRQWKKQNKHLSGEQWEIKVN